MYNRFSTMTEVRNAVWPSYETPEYDAAHFLQGIAGTLELFHRSTLAFQQLAGEATGHPVAVFQRSIKPGTHCRSTSGSCQTPTRSWCSARSRRVRAGSRTR